MAKRKPKKPTEAEPTTADLSYIVEPLHALAVPIAELQQDPNNARQHGEEDTAAIAASLAEFQQRTPIVVNKAGNQIEKGNGTFLAAQSLGWSHLAVVFVEDDKDTQLGYAIADNRTAELSEWNPEILAMQLDTLAEGSSELFDALMLDELVKLDDPPPETAGDQAVQDSFEVVAECSSEAAQKKLYDELTKKKYKCRLLTL